MIVIALLIPLASALVVLLLPGRRHTELRLVALAAALATLALLGVVAMGFRAGEGYQFVQEFRWIPLLGIGLRFGVDGLSLPLMLLTAVLFFSALLASGTVQARVKGYYAWFLFLESSCLGLFAALDLFVFYVFWDLVLVAMYFIIAGWGHEGARAAALKFFLYTLAGSMALLLGIIGLYLGTQPLSMDMRVITAQLPLNGGGFLAHLTFFALFIGFAIKTPVMPFHTWLPPAHVEAPAPGSAVLAGVLLKMGAYGLIRVLLTMMPATFAEFAVPVVALGVASAIYGTLVALAQSDLKRLIAYTSINHMGYVVMAVGAAAMVRGSENAKAMAIDGAVLQMVSHGLITGALFLLAGLLWQRTGTYDLNRLRGLSQDAPVFTAFTSLAAFAALGLPGLSGFVAEFQIFVGTFGAQPWAAATALVGIVITAGLFLWTLQRLLLGERPPEWAGFEDLSLAEATTVLPLLGLVVAIGVAPAWVLDVIGGSGVALAAFIAE